MICPKCGKSNSEDTKFCSECGTRLIEINVADTTVDTTDTREITPNTNVTTDGWYYSLNNQRYGPVDRYTVSNMLATGNIKPETLVWRAGISNWLRAGNTELFNAFPTINQATNVVPVFQGKGESVENSIHTKVPNTTAWLLATIPLGVSMLASSMGGQTGYYIGIAIAFVLNIVFLFIDDSVLRKHGVDTKKWSWSGLILIPVYLFIRSAKVGKKFGYSIMWCVFAFMDFCIYTALFSTV